MPKLQAVGDQQVSGSIKEREAKTRRNLIALDEISVFRDERAQMIALARQAC
jgi:hypothetical protein